jgi:hypothetical protein
MERSSPEAHRRYLWFLGETRGGLEPAAPPNRPAVSAMILRASSAHHRLTARLCGSALLIGEAVRPKRLDARLSQQPATDERSFSKIDIISAIISS